MKSNKNINNENWLKEMQSKSQSEINHMDDFEREAFEGWKSTGSDLSALSKLNKQFIKRSYVFTTSLVLIFFTLSIALYYLYQKPDNKQIKNKSITLVDKSDTLFPKAIDTLVELRDSKQIKSTTLVELFKNKQLQDTNTQNKTLKTHLPIEIITPIPLIELQEQVSDKQTKNQSISLSQETGKEIYLFDLKLLDYRVYREKPFIKTSQLNPNAVELTGTPANLQEKQNQVEETMWTRIDVPYYDYIKQTIKQFSKGNYKATLNRSQAILESYPDDLNALFYGGLAAYNLKDAEKSILLLTSVLKNPFSNFNEEALWYLAQAYEMKGDKKQAKLIYQQIIDLNGYYAKSAAKKIKSN